MEWKAADKEFTKKTTESNNKEIKDKIEEAAKSTNIIQFSS